MGHSEYDILVHCIMWFEVFIACLLVSLKVFRLLPSSRLNEGYNMKPYHISPKAFTIICPWWVEVDMPFGHLTSTSLIKI